MMFLERALKLAHKCIDTLEYMGTCDVLKLGTNNCS